MWMLAGSASHGQETISLAQFANCRLSEIIGDVVRSGACRWLVMFANEDECY